MKKVFIVMAALSFATLATAQEAKIMYIMKNNAVVFKSFVSDIDSIFFVDEIIKIIKNNTNHDDNIAYQSAVSDIDSIIFKPLIIPEGGVLINGVIWATCNVDKPGTFANKPEDVGMFYQWNRNIGWSTTELIDFNGGTTCDGTYSTAYIWEKSNNPCPSGWRVPTISDFTFLDGTKVEYKWILEKNGGEFKDINTGNTLFLPAVGYRNGCDASFNGAGSYGYYWSNVSNNSSGAYALEFDSSNATYHFGWYKVSGLSCRCVAE